MTISPFQEFTFMMMIMTILMSYWLKTNIMCMILIVTIMIICVYTSLVIEMSPIPQITFLTMVGGLMVIFLYFMVTMWAYKKSDFKFGESIIPPLSILVLTHLFMKLTLWSPPITKKILMFKSSTSMFTIILIVFLTIIMIITIKTHTKADAPIRKKISSW